MIKIYHWCSHRHSGRPCGRALILGHRSGSASLDFSQYLKQQLGSQDGIPAVKTINGEPAREIESLLRQDIASISTFIHLMDRDPSLAVAMVIHPEPWIGTPMTGKKRWMNVHGSATRNPQNAASEQPGKRRNTNDIRRELFKARGKAIIATRDCS